jgi:hypothetical protein
MKGSILFIVPPFFWEYKKKYTTAVINTSINVMLETIAFDDTKKTFELCNLIADAYQKYPNTARNITASCPTSLSFEILRITTYGDNTSNKHRLKTIRDDAIIFNKISRMMSSFLSEPILQ